MKRKKNGKKGYMKPTESTSSKQNYRRVESAFKKKKKEPPLVSSASPSKKVSRSGNKKAKKKEEKAVKESVDSSETQPKKSPGILKKVKEEVRVEQEKAAEPVLKKAEQEKKSALKIKQAWEDKWAELPREAVQVQRNSMPASRSKKKKKVNFWPEVVDIPKPEPKKPPKAPSSPKPDHHSPKRRKSKKVMKESVESIFYLEENMANFYELGKYKKNREVNLDLNDILDNSEFLELNPGRKRFKLTEDSLELSRDLEPTKSSKDMNFTPEIASSFKKGQSRWLRRESKTARKLLGNITATRRPSFLQKNKKKLTAKGILKMLNRKIREARRQRFQCLREILASRAINFIQSILIFLSIFGDDLRNLVLNKKYDGVVDGFLLIIFLIFLIELIFSVFNKKLRYLLSLFFFLDVLTTCSMMIDLSYVNENYMARYNNGTTAQLGKFIRIARLVRLLRLAKAMEKRENSDSNDHEDLKIMRDLEFHSKKAKLKQLQQMRKTRKPHQPRKSFKRKRNAVAPRIEHNDEEDSLKNHQSRGLGLSFKNKNRMSVMVRDEARDAKLRKMIRQVIKERNEEIERQKSSWNFLNFWGGGGGGEDKDDAMDSTNNSKKDQKVPEIEKKLMNKKIMNPGMRKEGVLKRQSSHNQRSKKPPISQQDTKNPTRSESTPKIFQSLELGKESLRDLKSAHSRALDALKYKQSALESASIEEQEFRIDRKEGEERLIVIREDNQEDESGTGKNVINTLDSARLNDTKEGAMSPTMIMIDTLGDVNMHEGQIINPMALRNSPNPQNANGLERSYTVRKMNRIENFDLREAQKRAELGSKYHRYLIEQIPEKIDPTTDIIFPKKSQAVRIWNERKLKKLIIIVLTMMVVLTLMNADVYTTTHQFSESILTDIGKVYDAAADKSSVKPFINDIMYNLEEKEYYLVKLKFSDGFMDVNDEGRLDLLRNSELKIASYSSSYVSIEMILDSSKHEFYQTLASLLKLIYITLVLLIFYYLYTKDSEDLVMTPLYKIARVINNLSKRPLNPNINGFYLRRGYVDNIFSEEEKEYQEICAGICRLSIFLSMAYGSKNLSLVSKNLLMKPGPMSYETVAEVKAKKCFAYFCFLEFTRFEDEMDFGSRDILVYLNHVTDIVYRTADRYKGSAEFDFRRNQFVIVWRLKSVSYKDNFVKVNRNSSETASLAITTILKILIKIHRLKYSKKSVIREMKVFSEKEKHVRRNYSNYCNVTVSAGKVFQAFTGSVYKMGVMHYSREITKTRRIHALHKKYKTAFLVTSVVYDILPECIRAHCRKINVLKYKNHAGVPTIQPIYCMDISSRNILEPKKSRPQAAPKSQAGSEKPKSKSKSNKQSAIGEHLVSLENSNGDMEDLRKARASTIIGSIVLNGNAVEQEGADGEPGEKKKTGEVVIRKAQIQRLLWKDREQNRGIYDQRMIHCEIKSRVLTQLRKGGKNRLFLEDSDIQKVLKKKFEFRRHFRSAVDFYVLGAWKDAKKFLGLSLAILPNDGPSQYLMGYLKERDFTKPPHWRGYQFLE